MKIYSASREDILKRQEENEASYQEKKARYDEQRQAYGEENYVRAQQIQGHIEYRLRPYIEPLDLDIDIRSDWNFNGREYYRVRIESNHGHGFGDEDKKIALSWSYEIKLDNDGNIAAESNSWSGLDATTPELLKNLQLSIDCLKTIQDIDWDDLLTTIVPPEYDEFITENDPNNEYQTTKRQLDRELEEADIESLIGTDTLVKVRTGKFYNNAWLKIFSQSAKQYTVGEVGNYMLDNEEDWLTQHSATEEDFHNAVERELNSTYRISKDKLFENIVKPIQTREF